MRGSFGAVRRVRPRLPSDDWSRQRMGIQQSTMKLFQARRPGPFWRRKCDANHVVLFWAWELPKHTCCCPGPRPRLRPDQQMQPGCHLIEMRCILRSIRQRVRESRGADWTAYQKMRTSFLYRARNESSGDIAIARNLLPEPSAYHV